MKKFLLCVLAISFVYGCGGTATVNEEENVKKELENYQGVCADKSFAQARAKLAEVDVFRKEGNNTEANKAAVEAKDLFNAAATAYSDAKSSIDKSAAEMKDQQSRLADLATDGKKYASKEYADAVKNVGVLHAEAEEKIAQCDEIGAEVALNDAEREVRYIEDLVAVRMSSAAPMTSSTDTYVVKKGDSLWKIASTKYANPYFWPLIYWSNKAVVKDPDLIYPNQKLTIDNGYTAEKKADAEKFAKTRGAWSLFDNK